jgi:2,3-bisphosphoglycerate-independent phosphoglycerate mutase
MKKVFLCILDGFGLGDKNYKYNAVFQSNIPNIKRFLDVYPHSSLKTSGESVGLPEGQMGNSEVGHATIGAGRVLMQDLPLISNSIKSGNIWQKEEIKEMLSILKNTGGSLHLLGLCSDGGVHASLFHIQSIANFFAEKGVKVKIHAISDGRDVPPQDFLNKLSSFEEGFHQNVEISTICGRFFTMDRDKKLERTEKGVNLILKAEGKHFNTTKQAVEDAYGKGITDEFIEASTIGNYGGVEKEDILFFANFRADRARQVLQSIVKSLAFTQIFTMMPYSEELSLSAKPIFKKQELTNTLPEVIANSGLRQLKIAETEKYAHVTFFLNGGKEGELEGEERILVPSPNVKTYDLKPEMSLPKVEENLLNLIPNQKFEFIACNVANGDMVGHTGNFDATKKAVERIDEFLGKMEEVCLKNGYTMLITADHGNLEEMLDENGIIHTQHTTLPVPFFVISKEIKEVKNGSLANIAPTVLKLLEIKIPEEMESPLI